MSNFNLGVQVFNAMSVDSSPALEEQKLIAAVVWGLPTDMLQKDLNDPLVGPSIKEAIKSELARRNCWNKRAN
jgi:hypothetical protein